MDGYKSIFFQSDFVHDLKVQKEFTKAAHHANRLVQLSAIALIGVLIWFYYTMVFRLNASSEFSNGMLGLTCLYLIFEGIRQLTSRGGGINYKRSLLTNGGKPVRSSVRFCKDSIITVNLDNDTHSSFAYDQVTSLLETENLLLLGMKYRLYLIVDKRALMGELGELKEFLCSKCPKVKKVHSAKPGILLSRVKYMVIAVLVLIALVTHPALQLKQRIQGQIHNGMSCSEIARELEAFGISGMDEDTLRAYDSIYASTIFLRESKLDILLQEMGMGSYHPKTDSWIPADSGVLWLYDYGMDGEASYTDLLRGIEELSKGELQIRFIEETVNNQVVSTTFGLNTFPYAISADRLDGRYDPAFFQQLNTILEETGKQLYFADCGGYSMYLFWCDSHWAESFSQRTGLSLTCDIYSIR